MENNKQASPVVGTAHSIGNVTVIDQDDLIFIRNIAYTAMAHISLYRWTTEEFSMLIAKKSLYQGSIPLRDDQCLKKEMAILNQLVHENIVAIYGIVQTPSTFGLAMEYCPFGSCKKFFTAIWEKSSQTSSMDKIISPLKIQIISEVISAMVYLHNRTPKQVLHLDLKSDNVLLNSQLHVKLCDFGLSKMKTLSILRSRNTSADLLRGTPGFISPERLKNLKAEPTTKDDVFSFGITCWEILTDRNPYEEQFSNISNVYLLEQHIAFNNLRPDVSVISDVYPGDLIDLIERAWATDPDTRPSFDDLDEEVQQMKKKLLKFDKIVDEARRRILTLHNMVNPGSLRTRRASLNDAEAGKLASYTRNIDIDMPCFENITVPKCHSWNGPVDPVLEDDAWSEREPLIPNFFVQKPLLSTTKTLVVVSFLLSVAAAIGVLIWWGVKTKGCPDFEAPKNGFINCTLNNAPSKCEFACKKGYKLIGNKETVCSDGYWSDDSPKCARVCTDVPEISHGEISCSNEEFVNSTCTTTCYDNHIVKVNSTVLCKPDGNWSNPFGDCECKKCNVGFSCEYSISWNDVASAVDDMSSEDHVTINYGGHVFICRTGIYTLKHHCVCSNSYGNANCEGYGTPTGAALHASSQLIRNMVAKGKYVEPCDGGGMPTTCG